MKVVMEKITKVFPAKTFAPLKVDTMKNFEIYEEYSTVVAKNLEGFCKEIRK